MDGDVAQPAKLLLGEGLLDELERLRLLPPVQRLGQLVPRLDQVAVVGVEVLLQHDLRGHVRGRRSCSGVVGSSGFGVSDAACAAPCACGCACASVCASASASAGAFDSGSGSGSVFGSVFGSVCGAGVDVVDAGTDAGAGAAWVPALVLTVQSSLLLLLLLWAVLHS
ncbi:hypothetical protein NUW58_g10534 [Xylaria curta]|uniref:Uncharacterized protein n=1 Tax=Xylaria curta TaxID=42375 RepID=A0ACC1ML73_9PEZI|nr:hypothetical protein NUW58_g10534 [Xylaria curta]